MKRIAFILLACLAACSPKTSAPSGAGLCWRMSDAAGGDPAFQVIAREVPNLESCAVQLDGARMLEGKSLTGAYNGNFIFATETQITSAKAEDSARIRVFETEYLEEIRAGLRALVEQEQAEAAPAP